MPCKLLGGSAPSPEALEIIKFPVARISVTEPNQAVQGLWCRETACFAPLTDQLRLLLKEVQATGIYLFSRAVSLLKETEEIEKAETMQCTASAVKCRILNENYRLLCFTTCTFRYSPALPIICPPFTGWPSCRVQLLSP